MARTTPRVTAQQSQEKWVQRISAAGPQIKAGIERVDQAPGAAAAAKFDKWLAGVQAGAQKWRRNVARVGLPEWREAALNVGLQRISQGAQAKQNKVGTFMNEFLPHLEAGMRKVAAMPDTTIEDRLQRMVAMARHNSEFRRGAGTGGGMGA